jgi:hypothetical protein
VYCIRCGTKTPAALQCERCRVIMRQRRFTYALLGLCAIIIAIALL